MRAKRDERQLRWKARRHDGHAIDVVSGKFQFFFPPEIVQEFFCSGRDNFRRNRRGNIAAHHHVLDVHDFPEIDNGFPHLRLDADSIR